MSTRAAVVAGQFYPADPAQLRQTVSEYLERDTVKEKALAVMAPHAGYVYSGAVAGKTYASTRVPETVVLIGPNHTGRGARGAVSKADAWQTPLGPVKTEQELATLIEDSSELFTFDEAAHAGEHSLEVQLPFIQVINPEASIVPITVSAEGLAKCQEMGTALAGAIKAFGKDVLIVISSDMNHYENDRVTREKDQVAIAQLLHIDSAGLLDICQKRAISMCGAIPMAIGMIAARALGAKSSVLTGYATSGEASFDTEHVVGYAGIMIR